DGGGQRVLDHERPVNVEPQAAYVAGRGRDDLRLALASAFLGGGERDQQQRHQRGAQRRRAAAHDGLEPGVPTVSSSVSRGSAGPRPATSASSCLISSMNRSTESKSR